MKTVSAIDKLYAKGAIQYLRSNGFEIHATTIEKTFFPNKYIRMEKRNSTLIKKSESKNVTD